MKVKIIKKHKSINPCEFELPDFTVLTGKNGSGKTHLLEAMVNKDIAIVNNEDKILNKISYIHYNGLSPHINEKCNSLSIFQGIQSQWLSFSNMLKMNKYDKKNPFASINNKPLETKIKQIMEFNNKSFEDLKIDDFFDSFDLSPGINNSILQINFAELFKFYQIRKDKNKIDQYYKTMGEVVNKRVLTDEEFFNEFGPPPWEYINDILSEMEIPYHVNNPLNTHIYSEFDFRLFDNDSGIQISSNDLSNGEKVLMSLALAIYNSNNVLGKPDLLLIDEPDAGLHPSMSKRMIDVLFKNIYTENKISVLITTHSPTTVIATEGISIYQLERGNNIPTKISKQEAVEILSYDVPFLRISTDKRRQVFVESKYDVNYYEHLSNILSYQCKLNSEPVFLPAKTSSGSNCSDVIGIVKGLYENGNDQVYGIVDWDNCNSSNERIIVLGDNKRYAIENYILDPLLMGLFLIRIKPALIIKFEGLSIPNYVECKNLTIDDAQIIINRILDILDLNSDKVIDYQTFNNWTLKVSRDFCIKNGHKIEELYKSKFPLLEKYQNENSLKMEVITTVITEYPIFTPKEIFDTILKIK